MATSVFMSIPDDDDNDIEPVWIIEATGEQLNDEDVAGVDWKASPEDTADSINRILEKHGLEIETMEDGSDSYWFRVKVLTPSKE